MKHTRYLAAIVAALLALALSACGGSHNPDPPPSPTATVPSHIPAPGGPTGAAGPTGPAGELDSTAAEIEELRDPVPDDIPKPVLEKAEDRNDDLKDQLPDKPIPQGGAQGYSMRTDYQTRGFGSYRSKVTNVCLHYTVSHNIPNSWADVYAIGGRNGYLQRVGLGATVVGDFDGHLLKTIPYDRSPYTQGWFNPYCESIEIIAYGTETTQQWMNSKLIKDGILAAWVRDRLKTRGLPLRFVDPVGCSTKLGYTDHNHLECGNDHHDVSPNFPFAFFARQVALTPRVRITKADRARCQRIAAYRQRERQRKHPGGKNPPRTKKGKATFDKDRRTNHNRRLKCVRRGKVARLR